MTSAEKAKLLGLFFWLFTGFNIVLITLIGLVYTFFISAVVLNAPQNGRNPPPPPELIIPIIVGVFIFLLVTTILFSIPKIVAGYGLRKNKPWARGWSIAASIMACMSFPFGTAIGVFGLVFLFGDDGKKYFGETQFIPAELQAPHRPEVHVEAPPPNSWQ